MRQNPDLLSLLLEVQNLDRVNRTGWVLRGVTDPESVADHSFQLGFLVWSLAPEVPELDRPRALELALLHDLGELRFGDLPRTAAGYLPEGAKRAGERAALVDLLGPLAQRGLELFDEYVESETLEARFVHACDRLQLMIKALVYESQGASGVRDFFENRPLESFDDGGFEIVGRLYAALHSHRDRG